MAFDIKQMERDVLETVLILGDIGYRGGSHSAASKVLIEKYSGSFDVDQRLVVIVDFLVEERYLFPVRNDKGEVSSGYARGITPKGLKRLRHLRHPRRTWVRKNWFPVVVAVITAFIGLGSIGANLYLNWD